MLFILLIDAAFNFDFCDTLDAKEFNELLALPPVIQVFDVVEVIRRSNFVEGAKIHTIIRSSQRDDNRVAEILLPISADIFADSIIASLPVF
jgi:hypothetical protein